MKRFLIILSALLMFTACENSHDNDNYNYYNGSSNYNSSGYGRSCSCTSVITTYGEYGSTTTDHFDMDKIDGIPCSDYNSYNTNEYGTVKITCY